TPSLALDAVLETFGKSVNRRPSHADEEIDMKALTRRLGGAHVLLVEDNAINQRVAREILENLGLRVSVADNGEKGVAWVRSGTGYDLVLMDVQMPVMDGYRATREIRADARFKSLPIVAMTANALTGDREACLASGMDDFITKPVILEQLYASLKRWIAPRIQGDEHDGDTLTQRSGSEEGCVAADRESSSKAYEIIDPVKYPGIQTEQALKRMGGNVSLYRELWADFHHAYHNAPTVLRQGLYGGGYPEEARLLVHTIKGVAGNLGAGGLHNAARLLERAIKHNRQAHWEERLKPFEQALQQVLMVTRPLMEEAERAQGERQGRGAVTGSPVDRGDEIIWAQPEGLEKLHRWIKSGNIRALDGVSSLADQLDHERDKAQADLICTSLDGFDFEGAEQHLLALAAALDIVLQPK
ncbi:MAG: response regulator, partial [Magnetococcales bacterium]|nr:response regulator [Magnetococcales bacterium]